MGTVVEGHAGIVVLVYRFLISEQSVQVKTFEGVDLGRSGPSQCLDIVDQ